jgi:hypothetical protein
VQPETPTNPPSPPTHRIDHVDKVPFVDRRGRERVALIPHYRRGEVVEDALHDARLGFYKSVPDLILSQVLVDQLHGIATISLEGAQRVIKGRLLKDHSSYRVVTALNLLDDYLAEDGSVASAFRRGYPDSNQLYLLLEYQRSAPNRVLPALVIQLVGSRLMARRHLWLFIPGPVATLSEEWARYPEVDQISKILPALVLPKAAYE